MPKIKICGITRLDDAIYIAKLNIWALGFIFYPKSKRYIKPKHAQEIINSIKDYNIKKIGVFVNEQPDIINNTALDLSLDYVQLHGLEPFETISKLKIPYIKNIRTIDDIEKYNSASYFLVDKIDTINWGGLNELSDWDFAKKIKELNKPLVLSGGLNSTNIIQAVRYVNPDVVDISSGVEDDYGIKNHELIKDFFDKIKSYKKE